MKAVSVLIDHWLVNRDLNCYINGKLVDDVTALTVLPVDGDYGAGIEALENWMTIRKDELAALLEQRNLTVPAFLRPSVKVSKAPPPGYDEEQAADAKVSLRLKAGTGAKPGGDWKENAKQIGKRIYKEKPLFSVDKIAEKTHKEMTARKANGESGMTGRGGKVPLADTIKRHALTGIKS